MSTKLCELTTKTEILRLQAVQLKTDIRTAVGRHPKLYRKIETIIDRLEILVEDIKNEDQKEQEIEE